MALRPQITMPVRSNSQKPYDAKSAFFTTAIKFVTGSSPSCLHHVSFAGCATLSFPSPCDRLSRLRVLWNDLTPTPPSVGLRIVVPPFPVAGERCGSPKFLCVSLRPCHDLRPRQAPSIQSSQCCFCWLPLIIQRRRLLHYCNEAQSLRQRCVLRLRPARFPMYAYVLSFTLLFLSKRQHLVRVVDYSLPDRDSHPARDTKLRLAHMMPVW